MTSFRSLLNTYCLPQLRVFPQVISQTWMSRLQQSSLHLHRNVDINRSIHVHCSKRKERTGVFHKVSSCCIAVHNRKDSWTDRTALLQRKKLACSSDHNGIGESSLSHRADTVRCDRVRNRCGDCLADRTGEAVHRVSRRLATRISRTKRI